MLASILTALVGIFLLSSCDKGSMHEDITGQAVSPEASAPARPTVTEGHVLKHDNQAPTEESRSVDSLKLSIMDDPYEETATTDEDWLQNNTRTGNERADDNLLPDLFQKREREKAATVKMDMRLDDDEPEISDFIDGAGVSIKYKTE